MRHGEATFTEVLVEKRLSIFCCVEAGRIYQAAQVEIGGAVPSSGLLQQYCPCLNSEMEISSRHGLGEGASRQPKFPPADTRSRSMQW
jgi:hypothetical protein